MSGHTLGVPADDPDSLSRIALHAAPLALIDLFDDVLQGSCKSCAELEQTREVLACTHLVALLHEQQTSARCR